MKIIQDNINPSDEVMLPAYIGYAIILITANYLECEVEMLDTAEKVWKTKQMPEPILLGVYEKAAHEAVLAISEKGLSGKANCLGELFTKQGNFLFLNIGIIKYKEQ